MLRSAIPLFYILACLCFFAPAINNIRINRYVVALNKMLTGIIVIWLPTGR